MNRKQRRHMKSQERKRKRKIRTVEKKMGTDFEMVTQVASRIEGVQETLKTMYQAVQEIPLEELNRGKMLENMEACNVQLQEIRLEGSTMGPAVRAALEEALEKSTAAVAELEKLLIVEEE